MIKKGKKRNKERKSKIFKFFITNFFKTEHQSCTRITRQVYNLFQDLWNKFLVFSEGFKNY